VPATPTSGLKLLIDYLDKQGLGALGVLQVLFSLYEADRALTVKQIYRVGSGYRRKQLARMATAGLTKRQLSDAQRRVTLLSTDDRTPRAYGLAAKGRYQVHRLMDRECPDMEDRGHLLRWLNLLKVNGISSYAQVRLLVQIDEAPGMCGKELFSYQSGTNKEQMAFFKSQDLIEEVMEGTRIEKYPGDRWRMLRDYLNTTIPDSMLK
jgi:hypothetical protein